MKKSVVSLALIGAFLLVSNLIFAQDTPSAADTQGNTDVTATPSNTQAYADTGAMPVDNTVANTDTGYMPADTQGNADATTVPTDTQENTDAGSMSADNTEANTDTGSNPADTQANADNAASGYGSSQ